VKKRGEKVRGIEKKANKREKETQYLANKK
jgi:hypothetical protein